MSEEKNFSELLKCLREERGLSVLDLVDLVKIPAGTIYAYESGRRGVPKDKAKILRDALCSTRDQSEMLDRAYAQALQSRSQSPFNEKFGSETTTLLVGDLQYPPFSGIPNKSFLNKFLQEMLSLAMIKVENLAYTEQDPASFDMEERMRWIEEREAHIIVNLQSPMRMRKLKFLPTPIRVSLNGVIMFSDDDTIRAARKLLVNGERDVRYPFQVIAIENEVGYVFLKETGKIEKKDMIVVNTLDAKQLADRLEPSMYKMLVCDEVTALAVVAEKKRGTATLVLPPTTDQSVVHFEMRRKTPAHYLGLGIGRAAENDKLAEYLSEAIQNFLSTELEVVAEMMECLYRDLVEQTRISFDKNSFLYSGEVRRVSKYLRRKDEEKAPSIDEASVEYLRQEDTELHRQYQARAIETLVEQNARSFARRCLNVSKRSIAENSDDLWPWRHVLRRTRERVLIAEARNRAGVREIVVSAMKSALGLDPIGNFGESYKDYFEMATDAEFWPDFKDMLERELDVTLPNTLDPMYQSTVAGWKLQKVKAATAVTRSMISPFQSLELLVSAVQRAMEANTDATRPVSVRGNEAGVFPGKWSEVFATLWKEYRREVGKDELPDSMTQPIRLIAFSLGQPVGFITGIWCDFKGGPALQVDHMYVIATMRKSGISRRLIRAVIDVVQTQVSSKPDGASVDWECRCVWISAGFRDDVTDAFERTGFLESESDGAYFYRLYGLREPSLT